MTVEQQLVDFNIFKILVYHPIKKSAYMSTTSSKVFIDKLTLTLWRRKLENILGCKNKLL